MRGLDLWWISQLDPAGRGQEVDKADQHHGLLGFKALPKIPLRGTRKTQLKWPQLVSCAWREPK